MAKVKNLLRLENFPDTVYILSLEVFKKSIHCFAVDVVLKPLGVWQARLLIPMPLIWIKQTSQKTYLTFWKVFIEKVRLIGNAKRQILYFTLEIANLIFDQSESKSDNKL